MKLNDVMVTALDGSTGSVTIVSPKALADIAKIAGTGEFVAAVKYEHLSAENQEIISRITPDEKCVALCIYTQATKYLPIGLIGCESIEILGENEETVLASLIRDYTEELNNLGLIAYYRDIMESTRCHLHSTIGAPVLYSPKLKQFYVNNMAVKKHDGYLPTVPVEQVKCRFDTKYIHSLKVQGPITDVLDTEELDNTHYENGNAAIISAAIARRSEQDVNDYYNYWSNNGC